ncbi:MAG: tetratricopeptide repeat protein [Xanthobacteraceae bacterium]
MLGLLIAIATSLVASDALGVLLGGTPLAHASHPYAEAARVMRAAESGNVQAQAQLGLMYSIGRGVPQNYVLAAKWLQCAAERGHAGAQFALGLLHDKGQGVQPDLLLSYMWLNLSASQAKGEDRDFKVRMRNAIASKMTVTQLSVAQQMALQWYVGAR